MNKSNSFTIFKKSLLLVLALSLFGTCTMYGMNKEHSDTASGGDNIQNIQSRNNNNQQNLNDVKTLPKQVIVATKFDEKRLRTAVLKIMTTLEQKKAQAMKKPNPLLSQAVIQASDIQKASYEDLVNFLKNTLLPKYNRKKISQEEVLMLIQIVSRIKQAKLEIDNVLKECPDLGNLAKREQQKAEDKKLAKQGCSFRKISKTLWSHKGKIMIVTIIIVTADYYSGLNYVAPHVISFCSSCATTFTNNIVPHAKMMLGYCKEFGTEFWKNLPSINFSWGKDVAPSMTPTTGTIVANTTTTSWLKPWTWSLS